VIDRFRQVLSRADTPKASVYFYEEVERWQKGVLDRFVEMGLLREIERSDSVQCIECEENCTIVPDVRVHPKTGETIGVYFCKANEDVGRFTVEMDRFRRCEFHFSGFCEAIARAIQAKGPIVEDVPGRVASVGTARLDGTPCDVFLARGLTWDDGPSVVSGAERLCASSSPLVLVPSQPPSADIWHGRPRALACLTDAVAVNEGLLQVDLNLLAERIALALDANHDRTVDAETDALARIELDILEAVASSPHETMFQVEISAAAGYSRRATREALDRLRARGFVARPTGTKRRGDALTAEGRAFLERRGTGTKALSQKPGGRWLENGHG
jgi:DNA-binding MarR family transcriptional regulator